MFQANEHEITNLCVAFNTYSLNVLIAGVVDWLLHPRGTVFWRQSVGSGIGTVSWNDMAGGKSVPRHVQLCCMRVHC